ncbi:MAG: SDR family NAD(P)-dependent oxidoreductase, partial [Desulfobacteraceae bacterium]|nr:SDR family NAD(P)-dependent oxidoreductase [Desulfobacteraceae bacterium]
MQLKDRIIAVTGAASGIGRAMARRFHNEGAKAVICADLNGNAVRAVADEIGGAAYEVNVAREADIQNLIENVENECGPIDLFCSNAGIAFEGGVEVDNNRWQSIWEINVMAHVFAARHLVPRMLERGGGYLLNTSSAAGLLSQIGSAPYAVTKHAAVS